MNKKNLSVVMAGAMLATSVAPVLADSTTENTYEVSKGNAGLVFDRIESLINDGKKFDKTDAGTINYTVSYNQNKSMPAAGESIYGVTIKDLKDNVYTAKNVSDLDYLRDIFKFIANDTNAEEREYQVTIEDRGYVEVNGKVLSQEPTKYTKERISQLESNASNTGTAIGKLVDKKVIEKVETDDKKETLTLTLAANENNVNKTITLTTNDFELDFDKPIDKNGNEIDVDKIGTLYQPADVVGFKLKESNKDIESKLLYTINLVKGDIKETVNCEDLYDGLMLTTKGHELLRTINEYKNDENKTTSATIDLKNVINKPDGSVNSFNVTLTDENGTVRVITIKGNNKARLETLNDWLTKGKANVDILAGTNRYATAVEIAKTYISSPNYENGDLEVTVGKDGKKVPDEVVLVNGEALVDGLAAAPYAKQEDAPILLTADNKLSKETKEYLKELASNVTLGDLEYINVTIIGGEAVVSQNVVDELKEMGFKVKRISGDNREETSLAVANKIDSKHKAFVVGAEGEADAMSIASRAAAAEQPIIVSKSKKGLSTVGINALSDYKYVEIIGGTSAVSSNDEEKIKEVVDNKDNVTRIAGKNRFETNALVIKKYFNNFSNVLVTNDGQKDKTKLVDALPVSIFASVVGNSTTNGNAAPIVLATDKVTDEQLNQIVLHANKNGSGEMTGTLYQVGGTVERSVMQTLADKLGLSR